MYARKVLLSAQKISKCGVNHRDDFLVFHFVWILRSRHSTKRDENRSFLSKAHSFLFLPSFFPLLSSFSIVEGRSLRNAHAAAHASRNARTFSRACERAYDFVTINPSNIMKSYSFNKEFSHGSFDIDMLNNSED